jgi:hypothetical protein
MHRSAVGTETVFPAAVMLSDPRAPSPNHVAAPDDPGPLAVPLSPPAKIKPRAAMLSIPGRCAEKGCVFPAMPGADGRCIHHRRQQQEPGLYCSRQPSSMLVARGKFGPPRIEEIEREARRGDLEDRRKMVAERERFLGE